MSGPLWSGDDPGRRPTEWLPPTGATEPPAAEMRAAGPVAAFWPRAGAAVIDFFVRLAFILGGLLLGALLYLADDGAGEAGTTVGLVIGVIAGLAYAPVMIARTKGQTVGHKAVDTRIVKRDGSALTGGAAATREVLVKAVLIDGIGGFLVVPTLVNYLWPLWDDDNEALHDKLCSTRVVEA